MKELIRTIRHFLTERFNLHEDKAEGNEMVQSMISDVNIKGANLWTLILP